MQSLVAFLPPALAAEVIVSVLSVWVCETYVGHYPNGTGLCCAPLGQKDLTLGGAGDACTLRHFHLSGK